MVALLLVTSFIHFVMLVSHRKQFIYTKTGKTASTSVELYFEPWCLPEGSFAPKQKRALEITEAGIVGYRGQGRKPRLRAHASAREIAHAVGPEIWDSYFKFTVVRNTYDKLVSAYFYFVWRAARLPRYYRAVYRLMSAVGLPPSSNPVAVMCWVKPKTPVEGFRSWLRLKGHRDHQQYREGDTVMVDYFIRYEELAAGMAEVCARLDIEWHPEALSRMNSESRGRGIPVSDFYDAEALAWVEKHYAWELARFGFKLED